jgi:hypothetical protein
MPLRHPAGHLERRHVPLQERLGAVLIKAIRAGKLQYRQGSMHGNPWLRLLRREVEELAQTQRGESEFRKQQARAELARVKRELRQHRTELDKLEKRQAELLADLGD